MGEDLSSGRQSRIEQLAKKIIEEDPTLSESLKKDPNHARRNSENSQPEKGSFRNNQRTRSASRERNLAKIKFCWRCHQTGHESFDCTAELQPANWCPRC